MIFALLCTLALGWRLIASYCPIRKDLVPKGKYGE